MGWQDCVALAVVFGALLHLLNIARRALFGGQSHCSNCASSRTSFVSRIQQTARGPRSRSAAPIGPILTIAPPRKKSEPTGAR